METNKKTENPQAFPCPNPNYDGNWNKEHSKYGMTLRDYFANSAMQASLTSPELMEIVSEKEIKDGSSFDAVARVSYKIADAMLKQRDL